MTIDPDATRDSPEGMTATARPADRRWLRWVVLVLAGVQTAGLIAFIGLAADSLLSSDPLGRAIAQAMVTLAAIPLVLFALPALILGVINRYLPLALSLAVLALPVAALLFHYA